MAGEIFISYRRADQDKARLLHALLKQRGVEAWYDALVPAGQDWRRATAKALDHAPIFVLLFSKVASESDDISKELAAATFSKKLVIPVRMENIAPTGEFLYELAARNWFDAFDNTEARFEVLADQLAALVKGGPDADVAAFSLGSTQPAPKIEPEAKPLFKRPAVLGGLAAAALAVMLAGLWLFWPKPSVTAAYDETYVLFPFEVEEGLAGADVTASVAVDEAYQGLQGAGIRLVARSEAAQPYEGARLDRAAELDATFALSGEVERSADSENLTLKLRLEDVSARTTIWEGAFGGRSDTPYILGVAGAGIISLQAMCMKSLTLENGVPSDRRDWLSKLAIYCARFNLPNSETIRRLRDVQAAAAHPGSLDGDLAWYLSMVADDFSGAARNAAMAEAQAALDRARTTDSGGTFYDLARARMSRISGAPLLEIEQIYAPAADRAEVEVAESAMAYAAYGVFLVAVGRNSEALNYLQRPSPIRPFIGATMFGEAQMLAVTGRGDAREAFERAALRLRGAYGWETYLRNAVFLDVADPNEVLDSAPGWISPQTLQCGREVAETPKLMDAAARQRAAGSVRSCLDQGRLSPSTAISALVALGDLAGAFEISGWLSYDRGQDPTATGVLFWPQTKAMREDERFVQLVIDLRLMNYWRDSGTRPDICATEDAEFCRVLAQEAG